FSGRSRHTRSKRDWSSDVCSSDLASAPAPTVDTAVVHQVAPQLNAAQAEAAAALASGTRLSVIEGYAGAGKTALLQAAVQLRDQRPLLTVTPTLKTAQEARSAGSDACSL